MSVAAVSPLSQNKYQPRPPPPKASKQLPLNAITAAASSEETRTAVPSSLIANEGQKLFQQGVNASPLHDVELYQGVLQLLPDCPVVDSILFTHRGVLEELETPNEMLATMESKIEIWRKEQKSELDKQYAQHQADESLVLTREYSKQKSEDEKRDAKINDFSLRIEALEAAIKSDVSRVVSKGKELSSPDGGPPENSYFRKEWELLQIRKTEREHEVKAECERLQAADSSKEVKRKELEFVSELAKLGINEQLTRCGLLSECDRNKLWLTSLFAASSERVSALHDAVDYIQHSVVEMEETERKRLCSQFLNK
eukprot:GILI01017186.1.p1 GENE.GILI01017186.1~~GILI01017186.1.p1  ORF type:complete len:326 (-),score=23.45 GILI01017186.1:62-1000(-)